MKNRLVILSFIPGSLLLAISTGLFAGEYSGDIEAGRVKSTKCAICHGIDGEGNGAPKSCIKGMDEEVFIKHVKDFRSGIRKNVMMQRFTKNLTDEDIENLAAYFGSR